MKPYESNAHSHSNQPFHYSSLTSSEQPLIDFFFIFASPNNHISVPEIIDWYPVKSEGVFKKLNLVRMCISV